VQQALELTRVERPTAKEARVPQRCDWTLEAQPRLQDEWRCGFGPE